MTHDAFVGLAVKTGPLILGGAFGGAHLTAGSKAAGSSHVVLAHRVRGCCLRCSGMSMLDDGASRTT